MAVNALALAGKFRGAILGGAVADALALPFQHYSRGFVRSVAIAPAAAYETHHSGFYPRGQYSDDTQLLLALIESIIEARAVDGESLASHFVPLWRDKLLIERDESYRPALERLVSGAAGPDRSGSAPGSAEIAPVAWCVGIGLWTHADPDQLLPAVQVATRLTHNDPRTLACAAACAAAIAHNVRASQVILGPFLDAMAGAAAVYSEPVAAAILDFPRLLSMTDYRAWREFALVIDDDAYPPSSDGLGTYCIPSFLTAVQSFLKSPHDYTDAVSRSIACGGHMDTPAFITGALAGSLRGDEALPGGLLDGLLNGREIAACADRFFQTWAEIHDADSAGEEGPSEDAGP